MKTSWRLASFFVLAAALIGIPSYGQQPVGKDEQSFPKSPLPGYGVKASSPVAGYTVLDGSGNHWFHQSQLNSKSAELAQSLVKSESQSEKNEIRKELNKVLTEQFDAHLSQQQKELEELEKQIAKLKGLIRKRLESKEAIVERRMEQLVQEAEGLGWAAPSGGATGLFPAAPVAPRMAPPSAFRPK
jgi:hypothetical protein